MQEGVAAVVEEASAGANGAAAAADRGRALLHDPRIARLGFALQFVIQARLRLGPRPMVVSARAQHRSSW